MNKTNIKRLLHTILPFMIMNMIQRSILLLFQSSAQTIFSSELVSLIAFVTASAAAVLTFSRKTYSDDSDTDAPPLKQMPAGMCIMQTVLSCAAMVAVMYALSVLIGGEGSARTEFGVLAVVSTLIIHPVIEEFVFRKMFYGELRLMNPIFGCIAQTLMFAILHSTIDGMIYALCSGLILCILYEHTGRIVTSTAAHIFINLRSVICLTVLSGKTDIIHGLDTALIIAGVICLIGCTSISSRSGRKNTEETADE